MNPKPKPKPKPSPVVIFVICSMIMTADASSARGGWFIYELFPRKLAAAAAAASAYLSQSPSPSPSPSPQVSPSPGPESSSRSRGGLGSAIFEITRERCPKKKSLSTTRSSSSCHKDFNNMTACLIPMTAPTSLFLLVQNDGESPLKLNLTIISNVKFNFPEIEIFQHQAKKINISAHVVGSHSIILNATNVECIIHLESAQSERNFYEHLSTYASQLTPIHGAYFFVFTTLIVGGVCACSKLGKSQRHVNGVPVPYEELEMGRPDDIETVQGWNESWDDEWEVKKEVTSPDGHQTKTVSSTSQTCDAHGWGNDWDV